MIAKNIEPKQMYLLPVMKNGSQVVDGRGRTVNEARAFNEDRMTFEPTGEVYPGDWEIRRRIYQQSHWDKGYAFAVGPFEDKDLMKNDRIQEERGAMGRQLWISVKPVWRRGETNNV